MFGVAAAADMWKSLPKGGPRTLHEAAPLRRFAWLLLPDQQTRLDADVKILTQKWRQNSCSGLQPAIADEAEEENTFALEDVKGGAVQAGSSSSSSSMVVQPEMLNAVKAIPLCVTHKEEQKAAKKQTQLASLFREVVVVCFHAVLGL